MHGQQGPYLLLVHGFLSSRAHWLLNLQALGTSFRPVVIELFGHARSPTPDDAAAYSPDAYVEEFEAIRELLGADRWFVCGQSLGAALTLRYSLDHPDRVTAQVFTNSNSALAGGDWAKRVMPIMEAQAKQLEKVYVVSNFRTFRPFVNGHLGGRLSLPAGPIVVPSLL